jgi:hypothetical protein
MSAQPKVQHAPVEPGSRRWKELVKLGREAIARGERVPWEIGDYANEIWPVDEGGQSHGAAHEGRRIGQNIALYAEEVGLTYKTTENYRAVANAWPATRRRSATSFKVHQTLKKHQELLPMLVQRHGDKLTDAIARKAVTKKNERLHRAEVKDNVKTKVKKAQETERYVDVRAAAEATVEAFEEGVIDEEKVDEVAEQLDAVPLSPEDVQRQKDEEAKAEAVAFKTERTKVVLQMKNFIIEAKTALEGLLSLNARVQLDFHEREEIHAYAEELIEIMAKVVTTTEPDWDEALSRLIGPTPDGGR